MARLFRRMYLGIALVCLCWQRADACALPSPTAFEKQGTMTANNPDCKALSVQLHALWRSDSTKVVSLISEVEDCFLDHGARSAEEIPKSQADTLMRMYRLGIQLDERNLDRWLQARAALSLRRPQEYGKLARRYLLEAIVSSPDEIPAYFYQNALDLAMTAYQNNRLPLNEIAAQWAMLDRLLLLRELGAREDAAQFAAVHERAQLQMRRILPDCNQLVANFGEAIQLKNLPADGCEAFLVIYDLQGCDRPELWSLALEAALAAEDQAWLRRLAGAEAFNRGQWEQSRSQWLQALTLEKDERLQAADQLQIAQAWLAQKDYRKARTAILEAMRLHPIWGEPYIRLMDLYLEGGRSCTLPAFDQKALYWLLCHLCEQLLNVDPNYAQQANERRYAYQRLAPTLEEAAMQGFKGGDTYPLKCWMSTSTTVPMH